MHLVILLLELYLLGFLIHPVNIHEDIDELFADVIHHLHSCGLGLLLEELSHIERPHWDGQAAIGPIVVTVVFVSTGYIASSTNNM